MSGKGGTSIELPAGLALCQYCNIIETEAAPQRFLAWRTKGTSSQNPGSPSESAPSDTHSTDEARIHAGSTLPATGASLLPLCRIREWESQLAAEVIHTEGSYSKERRYGVLL